MAFCTASELLPYDNGLVAPITPYRGYFGVPVGRKRAPLGGDEVVSGQSWGSILDLQIRQEKKQGGTVTRVKTEGSGTVSDEWTGGSLGIGGFLGDASRVGAGYTVDANRRLNRGKLWRKTRPHTDVTPGVRGVRTGSGAEYIIFLKDKGRYIPRDNRSVPNTHPESRQTEVTCVYGVGESRERGEHR